MGGGYYQRTSPPAGFGAATCRAALPWLLAAFLSASLVMEMGPIPLGLGSFEAACVSVLGLAGVPLAAALPATLLLRGFTLWLPMLPGLWLTRRELRHGPAQRHA